MKNTNKKSGITLIALVITIIVMLILVAVTISMAVNGGLFGYAGNAARDTKTEIDRELELANIKSGLNTDQLIARFTSDGGETNKPAYSTSLLDANGVLTENAIFTDSNSQTVEIPKGFKVSTNSLENTKTGGLVIQDENGNEFVWIPVVITGSTAAEKEEAFENLRAADYDEDAYLEPDSVDTTEYNNMKSSVIKNGGFFIARYEAGYSMTTERLATDSSTVVTPLSKKGAYPYNMVNYTDAKTASRNMYNNNSKYGVKSTLCYGIQWDAVLRFMGKINESDSTNWGNYKNSGPFDFNGKSNIGSGEWNNNFTSKEYNSTLCLQTGATDRNSYKNIYDIAGNISEWTMEVYQDIDDSNIIRGGDYINNGSGGQVANRLHNANIDGTTFTIGFRVALYIP